MKTKTEEIDVEPIALEMHHRADDDGCSLPWSKQSPKYRNQMRRKVRDVLAAAESLGLVLTKKAGV